MEKVQAQIDATNAYDLDRHARNRDGRDAAAAAGRARSIASPAASAAASRCARRSSSATTSCFSTSRPTTSTPRSVEWLEHHLAGVPRGRRRGHARPLLPRQRREMDPRTRPRPRLPVRRATTPAGSSRRRPGSRCRRSRSRPGRSNSTANWNGRKSSPRARMAKSKARLAAIDKLPGTGDRRGREGTDHPDSRPGRRSATSSCGPKGVKKALRRQPALRGHDLQPAEGRHRRRHRPERRGQDDAVQDDRRPGEAGRRQADGRRRR